MSKFGFSKKIYNDNAENFKGEYLINIALQNNEKISYMAFSVLSTATELYNTLPDLNTHKSLYKKSLRQTQNILYPTIRQEFLQLLYGTCGYAKKVIKNNSVTEYEHTIPKAKTIMNTPYRQQNLKEFCEIIFEYIEMLQNTGIVPITANYSEKDSFQSLYEQ